MAATEHRRWQDECCSTKASEAVHTTTKTQHSKKGSSFSIRFSDSSSNKWLLFFSCFHFSARAFERCGAKSCVVAFSTTNVFCRSNPLKTKLKVLSSLTSSKFSSYDYTAASELDSSVQLQCEQLNTYRCLLWYAQGKAYSLVLRGEVCSCLTCPPTLPLFSFFLKGGGRNTATNLPGANRHGLHKRGQHCVDRAVPSCERDHPPL